MFRRPEAPDPVSSIQIANAFSASGVKRLRLTCRKVTKTLPNTSFRQQQFATLYLLNLDPRMKEPACEPALGSRPCRAMRRYHVHRTVQVFHYSRTGRPPFRSSYRRILVTEGVRRQWFELAI